MQKWSIETAIRWEFTQNITTIEYTNNTRLVQSKIEGGRKKHTSEQRNQVK